jgi:hypothetical protein
MANRDYTRAILLLGWVYFIREAHDGLIKIGRSSWHPSQRLQELQVGCPQELTLLAYVHGKEFEGELHRRFRHLHHRGEWFRPAPDLVDFIAASKADPWHCLQAKAAEARAAAE